MYLSPTTAPRTEVVVVGALVEATDIGDVGWLESARCNSSTIVHLFQVPKKVAAAEKALTYFLLRLDDTEGGWHSGSALASQAHELSWVPLHEVVGSNPTSSTFFF